MLVTVLDHNTFGKDAIIGSYELDFTTIYMMDNHVLSHKWLGLINPEKDFNKITGYVKVSVNIVGEEEKQTQLTMDNEVIVRTSVSGGDSKTLFGDGELLLPPHI